MPKYKLSEQAKRCLRGEDTIAPFIDARLKREFIIPRPFFEARKRLLMEFREVLASHRSGEMVIDRMSKYVVDTKAADVTKSLISTHFGNILENIVGRRRK